MYSVKDSIMDRDGILKSIKSNLKGLVITEKNGYTPKKLRNDYKEFIGMFLLISFQLLNHSYQKTTNFFEVDLAWQPQL